MKRLLPQTAIVAVAMLVCIIWAGCSQQSQNARFNKSHPHAIEQGPGKPMIFAESVNGTLKKYVTKVSPNASIILPVNVNRIQFTLVTTSGAPTIYWCQPRVSCGANGTSSGAIGGVEIPLAGTSFTDAGGYTGGPYGGALSAATVSGTARVISFDESP